MRKAFLLALSAVTALGGASTAADAQRWQGRPGYGHGYDRHDDRRYGDRGHGRGSRGDRRRCDRGTGGTIIGAIAGGLAGNALVGRSGDRTLGTIAGAGLGAVAGRAIDRDC